MEKAPTARHPLAHQPRDGSPSRLDVPNLDLTGIDWVIVGGESGPGARRMKREWVTEIRDQCQVARVHSSSSSGGGVHKTNGP